MLPILSIILNILLTHVHLKATLLICLRNKNVGRPRRLEKSSNIDANYYTNVPELTRNRYENPFNIV